MNYQHFPTEGSTGTLCGVVLRFSQVALSMFSFLFVTFRPDYVHYTSFRFLCIAMHLVFIWSAFLFNLECYGWYQRRPLFQYQILMIVIFDWVFSLLSLAAGSASAGVLNQILRHEELCRRGFCVCCQISAASAIVNWFLIAVSAYLNAKSLI